MVFAAVETVTNADPVGEPRRLHSDVAAQATASESIHVAPPLQSSGQHGYTRWNMFIQFVCSISQCHGYTGEFEPEPGPGHIPQWELHVLHVSPISHSP